tara:strand:- start:877 stop:1308 length:432 start_codon:yes stop_codon:yes gene_type:complete
MSTYDNDEKLYWTQVNDVRKYITYRKIGVNKLPDVILRDFSSEHLDGFFRFAVGAMSLNLGDAANFNEEKKMEKIKVSFDRSVFFFKIADALRKRASYTSCERDICLFYRVRGLLLDFRNMAKRERELNSLRLLVPGKFLKTL